MRLELISNSILLLRIWIDPNTFLVLRLPSAERGYLCPNESMHLTCLKRLFFLGADQRVPLWILVKKLIYWIYGIIRVHSSLMSLASGKAHLLGGDEIKYYICSRFDQPVYAVATRGSLESCLAYFDVHQKRYKQILTLQEA